MGICYHQAQNEFSLYTFFSSLIHSNFDICRVSGMVLDTGNIVVNKPRS